MWLWNKGGANVHVQNVTLVARTATGEMYASALVRRDRKGEQIASDDDALYFLRSVRQMADCPIDYRTASILVKSPTGVILQLEGPDVGSRLQMAAGYVREVSCGFRPG